MITAHIIEFAVLVLVGLALFAWLGVLWREPCRGSLTVVNDTRVDADRTAECPECHKRVRCSPTGPPSRYWFIDRHGPGTGA